MNAREVEGEGVKEVSSEGSESCEGNEGNE
jgi:hypothetical protein